MLDTQGSQPKPAARLRALWAAHRDGVALAVLALVAYSIAIGWGLPEAHAAERVAPWGHDDITPMGPLGELYAVLVRMPERPFLGYPLMHHMLLCVAYAPYLAWLWLAGDLGSPMPQYPFGLRDPASSLAVLTLIARFVSVAMGAGIVLAARSTARVLWGARAGTIAGLFALLQYPMFYYAHTGNLDVPYIFWACVGVAAWAHAMREGFDVRRAALVGFAAALAVGTKDQAAAMFLPFALLAPLHWRATRDSWRARWLPPVALLSVGLTTYAVASGFVLNPARWLAHVRHILGIGEGAIVLPNYPATAAGYAALLHETLGWLESSMGVPMLAAALVGLGWCVARDRAALCLALPALGIILFFVLPARFVIGRYVMGSAWVLALFAALPFARALDAHSLVQRRIALVGLVLVCALPVLRAVELTAAKRNDSRYVAAAWIDATLSRGARVGFFGPDQKLPRISPGLSYTRVDDFRGTIQGVRYTAPELEAMADRIVTVAPDAILVIPDHTVMLPDYPHGLMIPPALRARLLDGSLGFSLARTFEQPALWLEPPLIVDDYKVVNPRVEVYLRVGAGRASR